MTDYSADSPAPSRSLVRALTALIAVAVLAIAVAAGWFWGDRSDDGVALPTVNSVDAGFARDMSVHHRQAITMSAYEIAHGSSPAAKLFAYDIQDAQTAQLGEMQGWLEAWGQSPISVEPMSWMGGHMAAMVVDGLMPGMAQPAQMAALRSATGTASDVLFLQLMINHHLGGVAMARYAAQHATEPYVVNLAQKMVNLQSAEITQMEQTLRQLGGSPLSPPAMS